MSVYPMTIPIVNPFSAASLWRQPGVETHSGVATPRVVLVNSGLLSLTARALTGAQSQKVAPA